MSVISVLMEIVVLMAVICAKSPCVRSGIRTHAYISRLRPERSALDHSAILTVAFPKIACGHGDAKFRVLFAEIHGKHV